MKVLSFATFVALRLLKVSFTTYVFWLWTQITVIIDQDLQMLPRNQHLEFLNSISVGTFVCKSEGDTQAVQVAGGQVDRSAPAGCVYTASLLCLRRPCCCLHTLGVSLDAVVRRRKRVRESSGVPPPTPLCNLLSLQVTHTHQNTHTEACELWERPVLV